MHRSVFGLSVVLIILISPVMPLMAQYDIPPDMAAMMEGMMPGDMGMMGGSVEDYTAGMTVTEGLFTYYTDESTHRVLIEINPEQLESPFFISTTISSGGPNFMMIAPMLWTNSVFEFSREGDAIEFVEPNYQYSTVPGEPMAGAFETALSDTILGRSYIEVEDATDGRILLDFSAMLMTMNPLVSYSSWYGGYAIDWEGSYVSNIAGYPMNDEIDTRLLVSSAFYDFMSMMSSASGMGEVNLHFSLSAPPDDAYNPRIADDRVGYFMNSTMVFSAETDRADDRITRFVNRWRLEKADPDAEISAPVEPIVFWLENTIPLEYRSAVREGILAWNDAFECAGFRNAIQARQMPDDADWDPSDVRYNTVRWFVSPFASFAIGPSRSDPRTGEIYDADVGVSANMMRYAFQEWDFQADPISDMMTLIAPPGWPDIPRRQVRWDEDTYQILENQRRAIDGPWAQDYGSAIHAYEGARASAILYARGMEAGSEEEADFIRQYLVSLVIHEVGHVLGLRHNFAGSSATPWTKLHQAFWTREHGLSQSIMDYAGSNIAPFGQNQGEYFQCSVGDYDRWAIEFAYRQFNAETPEEELELLNEIASRAPEPQNRYAPDEDMYGYSGMDPDVNVWELGSDLTQYYRERLEVSNELMDRILEHWSEPGTRPPKLRTAFLYAIFDYYFAGFNVPTVIGGVRAYRDHIGDPNAHPSMVPCSAEEQRRAMYFIESQLWDSVNFQFDPELVNMLAADRQGGLSGYAYGVTRDIDLHDLVLSIQTSPFYWIYDSQVMQRILNNEIRMPEGEEVFTLVELFDKTRNAVWQEVFEGTSIDSYRRNLQRAQLEWIIEMMLDPAYGTPEDAITLARRDLLVLKDGVETFLGAGYDVDAMTVAHLEECLARIELTLSAPMDRGGGEMPYILFY